MLTRDEILVALQDAITEYQEFELADEIMDVMELYDQPFDLVAPILEFISEHPEVDFGSPGYLVHFVERFYHQGYEDLLMEAVGKRPTPHNIWMLYRCCNGNDPNLVPQIQALVGELKKDKTLDSQVRTMIENLTW
ncbi:hypothetical protein [Streptococcus sp. 27098_8_69]|uniref:hypothetical protein n=1 Tax=Streptococcus sp. 27098_8_69 TaxID=3003664 RepID=UPI00352EB1F2